MAAEFSDKGAALADLLSRHGIKLQSGNKCCCFMPEHTDRKPSMSIDLSKGFYNCHSGNCGASGDAVDALMILDNISKSEALRICGIEPLDKATPHKRKPVTRPEPVTKKPWLDDDQKWRIDRAGQNWTTASEADQIPEWYRARCCGREISLENLIKLGIKTEFKVANADSWKLNDFGGEVIIWRATTANGRCFYIQAISAYSKRSFGVSCHPTHGQALVTLGNINTASTIIIVEGISDALAVRLNSRSEEYQCVVATTGTSIMKSKELFERLKAHNEAHARTIEIMCDGDEAGRLAGAELTRLLRIHSIKTKLRHCPDDTDPADIFS